jgi:hypothetical protein
LSGHKREKREEKLQRKERGKCPSFLGFALKERKREGMVAL